LPERIPIDTAIMLFQEFFVSKCQNVAVYAEETGGDWIKHEIGIEVKHKDPVQIITQFTSDYPPTIQKYTGKSHLKNLFIAKCTIPEMKNILPSLLNISPKKHVRIQESGGLEGMPAARYVEVLNSLKELGVESVSFYGVYIE
jgi:hypothetical protein